MIRLFGIYFCAALLAMLPSAPARAEAEVTLTDDEFKNLDHFEAFALQKADKAFLSEKKEYKQAAAEYDAFALDNPRSKALPYALLRKARCIHLSNKRHAAVKAYQEVVDFFPENATMAGGALYYIGLCHWEDGETEQALKAWAKMAEHPQYKKHFLAATAINRLAESLLKKEQAAKAIAYFTQVVVDFRSTNPDAARHAMWEQVIPYYIRTAPNEPKLREFYAAVKTFEKDPKTPGADPADDRRYWTRVREYIEKFGAFSETQAEQRKQYFAYWAQQMQGKFPDWDDFQIDAAAHQRAADGNETAYAQRLDEQFSKFQKSGDYARVVKWIQVYAALKHKRMEYYQKLDFAQMNNALIQKTMNIFYDFAKDPALARNVFQKIRLAELTDEQKKSLARHLWGRDGELVKVVTQNFKDAAAGQLELLHYYHSQRDSANGLPLCAGLKGVPEYTKDVLWKQGEFHQWKNQHAEAIAAFRESDNPPASLFKISECQVKLGQIEPAVEQLRQVENFFKDHAPEAALRIAHVYQDAKMKEKYEAALRAILKKYPKSGQSSSAHLELEKMGAKIGGGVDAD